MSATEKPSLWALGGLTPLALGKRVWRDINEDEVGVRSTSLAYYFILAVFPALFLVLAVVGLFASAGPEIRSSLYSNLARLMPGSASTLVQNTLQEVMRSSTAGKALFGILGALWAASQGVSAIMQCLNVAYDVEETRAWWKQKAISIGLTIALAVLVLAAVGLLIFGPKAADVVGARLHLSGALVFTWKIVQWPLVLALMFVAFAVTYYVAANLKEPEWHWITPGSVAGLVCWLIASFGFKIYLHFFDSYSKTYGSLGAVIILLLWLYMTGFCIMLGGEVNSEIGRAAESQVREERRERQRRRRHQRDARTLWGDRDSSAA